MEPGLKDERWKYSGTLVFHSTNTICGWEFRNIQVLNIETLSLSSSIACCIMSSTSFSYVLLRLKNDFHTRVSSTYGKWYGQ